MFMKDRTPKVSIGLPVYNGGKFIEETIKNVLSQDYKDYELIISDNASTDNTRDICHQFVEKDKRIQYFLNSQNFGLPFNYKQAFDLSKGEYFKWISADDKMDPGYLSRCVKVLDQDKSVVLVCTKVCFIDESGNIISEKRTDWNLQSNDATERLRFVILQGGHWADADAITGLIRSSSLVKTRFLPAYQGGDRRPLGELCLLGKFFQIKMPLYYQRLHPNASSYNTGNIEWMLEFFKDKGVGVFFPTLCLCADHFRTVWNSDLKVINRLKSTVNILKLIYWARMHVYGEIRLTSRYLINRSISGH